jgi:tetratricopeptide (TPR) repeat protein
MRLNGRNDFLSGIMVSLLTRIFPRLSRGCRGKVLSWAVLFSTMAAFAEPRMDVTMDHPTIAVSDSATLSIVFQDCSPEGRPELPPVAGLRFGDSGSQQNLSVVNGAVTRSTTYTIEVRAARPGRYTIPAMQADVGGAHLTSRPVTLNVVAGAVPTEPGEEQTAFLKIEPAVRTAYVGQIIPLRIEGYCRDNVANISLPQLTSDNFIIGEIPNSRQQASRAQVGNAVFNHFSFQTTAKAIKTGKFEIGPATWSMTVFGSQRNIFGWAEQRQGTFTSDSPEITVLPIPTEGAPASFTGAVGRFNLSVYEAGPTTVGAGDPITLKIRISGRGAFETVNLPTNNDAAWREFKTYPPTAKIELTDPGQAQGSKYFEQVITPQNAEVKEIPPFNFSYFDPEQRRFMNLMHDPIPLTVHATAAVPQPTVVNAGGAGNETQEPSEDIVHIKPMMGQLEPPSVPLLEQKGFLALQSLAPGIWICAFLRRKAKEKLANNPRLRRQRQVAATIREGLQQLPAFAAANDAEQFYATVLRLLQEQLGERMDLPAPAITEAVLDELPQKGLRPDAITLLHELFQACNQYRYTPEHAAREMNSLIPKVKSALEQLQSMPAVPGPRGLPAGVGLIIVLTTLTAFHARAEAPADAFLQANRLFEEGKYAPSAAAYEKIIQRGAVSPELYFNFGNACLKAGQFGRAICAYRRAEALAPRDPDIRANLQIARNDSAAGAPALPGSPWTRWVSRMTLNEWTVAESAALALLFLTLAVREMRPSLKKGGAGLAILGSVCVGLGICLTIAAMERLSEKFAVVVVPEAVVRRGPLPEAQSAFTVHDGAELRVVGTDGDWLQVSDAANHSGWLAQKEVATLP